MKIKFQKGWGDRVAAIQLQMKTAIEQSILNRAGEAGQH
jgi:hypothetical protein